MQPHAIPVSVPTSASSCLAAALLACLGAGCQSGVVGGDGRTWSDDAGAMFEDADAPRDDTGAGLGDAGDAGDAGEPDAPVEPPPTPVDVRAACAGELCWTAGSLVAACGAWSHAENFSSGRYGVHSYSLQLRAGVRTQVTAAATGGAWSPALLVVDAAGATLHDGEVSIGAGPVLIEEVSSGRGASSASLVVVADTDLTLTVMLTSWANRDAGFGMRLPTDATYDLDVEHECDDPRTLYSPPNFDASNVVGGYSLLPHSEPSGLYSRRADGCSRGTKRLIDVVYTAALRWSQERPDLPMLGIADLNEGPCSNVDHATHDDGTHVDMSVSCGTEVSCTDDSAAIDLAKMLVDTGAVCGILFNDTAVQAEVNAYFAERFAYEPWRGRFMRTVTGHTRHFHVRVMKPDGTCN